MFQVQRPVHESLLDLDVTLDALMGDSLNTRQLYTVRLNTSVADWINTCERTEGHPPVTAAGGLRPAKVNGTQSEPSTTRSKLCEESLRETFSRFGPIKSVTLPAEPGRRARHAHIREFKASFSSSCLFNMSLVPNDVSVCLWGGQSSRVQRTNMQHSGLLRTSVSKTTSSVQA